MYLQCNTYKNTNSKLVLYDMQNDRVANFMCYATEKKDEKSQKHNVLNERSLICMKYTIEYLNALYIAKQ